MRAAGPSIPYFKINASLFCCPLFSKQYLNPQVRINKMVNVVLIVIPVLQNEPQGYILMFL